MLAKAYCNQYDKKYSILILFSPSSRWDLHQYYLKHMKKFKKDQLKTIKKNTICNKKAIFMFTLTKCTDFSKHIDTKHNILIGWKVA